MIRTFATVQYALIDGAQEDMEHGAHRMIAATGTAEPIIRILNAFSFILEHLSVVYNRSALYTRAEAFLERGSDQLSWQRGTGECDRRFGGALFCG